MSTKFFVLFTIAVLLLAVIVRAEPPRYRTSRRNGQLRTNLWFLQRQEEAPEGAAFVEPASVPIEASAAPYPPAGIIPEVPFEIPTETTARVPDNSYGPPVTGDTTATTCPTLEAGAAEQLPPNETAKNLVAQNVIQPRQCQRQLERTDPLHQRH